MKIEISFHEAAMIFNLSDYSPNSVYHLMTQTVIPRPVAWILTENSSGNHNLAPFSYFTALCSDPALIVISVGKKDKDTPKDTRKNILERKSFVVHIASSSAAEAMTASAATLDYAESEIELTGEKLVEFEGSALPRLESCKVAMLCELYDSHNVGPNEQAVIYGEVKKIYVEDDAVSVDGKRISVDAKALDPISRLGGAQYGFLGEIKEVKRPA